MARIAAVVRFNGASVSTDLLDSLTLRGGRGTSVRVAHERCGQCGVAYVTASPEGCSPPTTPRLRFAQQQRSGLFTADARLDNRSQIATALGGGSQASSDEPGDAGIVLRAYLQWGVGCVQRLAGDFAFAIWDDTHQRLFCARDALGVKPLYYAMAHGTLYVASEPRQILHQPRIGLGLKESAVAEYLAGYCTEEQASFFEGVNALPAGHFLIASRRGVQLDRYWYPEHLPAIRYRDSRLYAEHFREIFEQAVTTRIRDQDRVAVCVSGGLDSGSVAAVARTSRATHNRIQGFTRVSDSLPECDERQYSRHLRDTLGLEIEPVPCERFWLLEDDEAFAPHVDSPFHAFASYERYVHSRCRELGIRVLLTGHGGDSVVAGSGLAYLDRLLSGDLAVFRDIRAHAKRNGQPARTLMDRYMLRSLISPAVKTWVRARVPWQDPAIPSWLEKGFARRTEIGRRARMEVALSPNRGRGRRHRIAKVRDLGGVARAVRYLDRCAYEFGLEYRHPFLDRRLVEYTLRLPDQQLLAAGETKRVLRAAVRNLLPDPIRTRADKTYPNAFVNRSLRDVSAHKISAMFADPICAARGFVDPRALRETWQRFLAGDPSVAGHALWFPVTLEAWLRSTAFDL